MCCQISNASLSDYIMNERELHYNLTARLWSNANKNACSRALLASKSKTGVDCCLVYSNRYRSGYVRVGRNAISTSVKLISRYYCVKTVIIVLLKWYPNCVYNWNACVTVCFTFYCVNCEYNVWNSWCCCVLCVTGCTPRGLHSCWIKNTYK